MIPHEIGVAIANRLPQVQIVDRLVVLRTVKRMGRLVDTDGRAVGVVPINIWDDTLAHPTTAPDAADVADAGPAPGTA